MQIVPRPIRWLAILLVAATVLYVVGIGGYGFTAGADQYLAQSADHPSCETPGSKFGWSYEAVNYDFANDATMLAANST
jgi:hypothetical protein